MKYIDEYRDPELANRLSGRHKKTRCADLTKPVTIMEVCGSHTQAIGRYGIRNMLPESIRLISGPGCPVCVTSVRMSTRRSGLPSSRMCCLPHSEICCAFPVPRAKPQQLRARGR